MRTHGKSVGVLAMLAAVALVVIVSLAADSNRSALAKQAVLVDQCLQSTEVEAGDLGVQSSFMQPEDDAEQIDPLYCRRIKLRRTCEIQDRAGNVTRWSCPLYVWQCGWRLR